MQVNCQVSNDLKELQCLHDATGWTPGATHIRPTAETRALKEEYLNDALQSYATLTDFVLDTVFGLKTRYCWTVATMAAKTHTRSLIRVLLLPTRQGRDGLFRADKSGDGDDDMEATKVLEENKFPYSLPPGTRHSILWYLGDWRGVLDGDTITDHVSTELAEVIGGKAGATFEFVWYENPKMSIPDIFHVQVFWRELCEEEV